MPVFITIAQGQKEIQGDYHNIPLPNDVGDDSFKWPSDDGITASGIFIQLSNETIPALQKSPSTNGRLINNPSGNMQTKNELLVTPSN